MNRALLIGITDYREKPLNGCVNDVNDMKEFLLSNCGFSSKEIRLISNNEATQKNILALLNVFVKEVKSGDRLLFHYSGHGAQMPTINPAGEVDGLDEIICPIDFAWTDDTAIRDKDFNKIFSSIPAGVLFTWISDSCNSGDLIKLISKTKERDKRLLPPAEIVNKIKIALNKKIELGTLSKSIANLNVAMISGCRSDQTSGDDYFNTKYNGVLTYYLLEQLKKGYQKENSIEGILEDVKSELSASGRSQVPQLEGSNFIFGRPFLE